MALSRPLFLLLSNLLYLLPGAGAFNSTINRNYFSFPPLIDWIPVFKVGDAVNVSWATEWNSRNINVWCGAQMLLIQSYSNLPKNGYQLTTVLDSWIDPCHMQFFAVNATTGQQIQDFNSGAFNVDSNKGATPTTWAAQEATSAYARSSTGGSTVPQPTNTVPVNGSAATTQSAALGGAASDCASARHGKGSKPSFGAGIGVGIALAAGIAAATVLIWWLLQRKRSRSGLAEMPSTQTNGSQDYTTKEQYQPPPPAELHHDSRQELPS